MTQVDQNKMVELKEAQAYVEIKMSEQLNFEVCLFQELRNLFGEDKLREVVLRAAKNSMEQTKKVQAKLAPVFSKYDWKTFPKYIDDEFTVEVLEDKVIIKVTKCPLMRYRRAEPLLCEREHEYIKMILEVFMRTRVKDFYELSQTFDSSPARYCELIYYKNS